MTVQIAKETRGWYRAWCPSLPGCMVVGQTRQEAEAKIVQAIEGYLASLDVALPRELGKQFRANVALCG